LPLIRCALLVEEVDPIARVFGTSAALLGVGYAIFEKDTKQTLAWSTISQLGFILAAPVAGGFYALTHALVKSVLFLIAGSLPSRDFSELRDRPLYAPIGVVLVMASLAISGLPFFAGFGAKTLSLKYLLSWQTIPMNIAALGTTIAFAKFVFLPWETQKKAEIKQGLWWAIGLLLGGLIIANAVDYEVYTVANIIKSLAIIGLGYLAYFAIFKRLFLQLPRLFEQFDHLIGMMSLMLVLLFWMVIS